MAWEEFHRTGVYVAKSVSPHFRRVFQNLNEPECLVEVGCGTGRNLEYLRETFPYSDICATDLSVDALKSIYVDNIEKAAGDVKKSYVAGQDKAVKEKKAKDAAEIKAKIDDLANKYKQLTGKKLTVK